MRLLQISMRHKCTKSSTGKFSHRILRIGKEKSTVPHPQARIVSSPPNITSKPPPVASIPLKHDKHESTQSETRFNPLNLQMISRNLYEQLFPLSKQSTSLPLDSAVNETRTELRAFGINVQDSTTLPDVELKLPKLEGNTLEEHFFNIAEKQVEPYLRIIQKMVDTPLPEIPKHWVFQEGWTRYSETGIERVDHPLEDGLVFDVEVCNKEGPLPTLATAASTKAWYSWVSKSLIEGSGNPTRNSLFTMDMLVPIEGTTKNSPPKVVVGHNVCYDRARIKEQYRIACGKTRFLDTMSMHIGVSGINSFQRTLLKVKKGEEEKEGNVEEKEEWKDQTSLNNLSEVHRLYCGTTVDKSTRDVFVEGSLADVRERFQELTTYCARDTLATHEVFRELFPLFRERFPHPVTLAGTMELGTAYLPVNSNWQRYLEESELTSEDLNYEAKVNLSKRADQVCSLIHEEKYKKDLWMWDQDWSVQRIKVKQKPSVAKSKEVAESEKLEPEEAKKEPEEAKKEPEEAKKEPEEAKKEPEEAKKEPEEEEEVDPLKEEFSYLGETKRYLPVKLPHMPGYPAWYRKLCPKVTEEDWAPGAQNISTSMQVAPKLLNLTWENYPLHYIRGHGWGFLVPFNNDPGIETQLPLLELLAYCPLPNTAHDLVSSGAADHAMNTLRNDVQKGLYRQDYWKSKKRDTHELLDTFYKGSGIWCDVELDNCCWFLKLPHKSGPNFKVGNPLAKDFLNKFSENVLAGLDENASRVLKVARMVSYWRNNRDRIFSQMVVWLDPEELGIKSKSRKKSHMSYGAILPQVIVSGTVTRRAVEPTWMTASNSHVERVGSELRAMIQAPPGYNIVGADVDSQELWIASTIGDAFSRAKIHGATPFGWMTLIGSKSSGTDMHSVTAKAVGISRDHAKVINYARIYGAGMRFAENLLQQFNPTMTQTKASSKARKMFAMTKGKRVYRLKPEFANADLPERDYTGSEAYKLAQLYGKHLEEMFGRSRWLGGSESSMFNKLEEIAGQSQPVTPFLGSRLSRALEKYGDEDENDRFLPTKINWVVQSGAVDFLHLMLVSMRWLMRDNARFCLSFHDEIRYLVPSKYKYNAALAMHLTNLLTRSFCSAKLGIHDLPMSVAFFASVEVDTVLRKESTHDCKTPSNPHGLEKAYGIPPGESLDIWKTIEKSKGVLHPKDVKKSNRKGE